MNSEAKIDNAKIDETKAAILKKITTPAGGQINCDWGQLTEGKQCLSIFLAKLFEAGLNNNEWHIMFRCGTIARVGANDPEWPGFNSGVYAFPGERDETKTNDDETVNSIMEDNQRVWKVQSQYEGDVGKAIRQGFHRLLAPGYPYPGNVHSDRSVQETGMKNEETGMLSMVYWPSLDKNEKVYNYAFSKHGINRACAEAGINRRQDYMFPEVAMVVSPTLDIWTYGSDSTFGNNHEL